jgi:hypothetical protein
VCLVQIWSTRHRNRAVSAVSSGAWFARVTGAILQKLAGAQNPDKYEVAAVIGLVLPCRPIRPLVTEDRSADGVSDRTGPHFSVRAGSVPQRSTTGIAGHQRSPTVQSNRRSLALRLKQLG